MGDNARVEELERSIEEHRSDAQRRTKLLAHLSHELRTPMSAVLGMIELLLGTEPDSTQTEMLMVAKQASNDLLTLINDILDLSKLDAEGMRLEAVQFDITDVIGMALSTLRPLASEKDIFLASDIPIGIPERVTGDPGRLRQILINLVGNAIKFTEQGSVVVGVRMVAESEDSATIRIDVADTGTGIPSDRLDAIFDPYEQAADSTSRTHGGTGLGLAICRQLADLMDGRLTVTSTIGRGSTFSLVLSFATRDTELVEFSNVAPTASVVLMPPDSEALVEQVSAIGLPILDAPSAQTDLILVDLDHLGFADIELIRGDHPKNPVLIVTTTGQRGDAARSQDLGVAAYLTRPVEDDELKMAIGASQLGVDQLITRHWLREQTPRQTVLIVEDDEASRQVTVHMLEQLDYSTIAVPTATQAIEALAAREFDLIFCDLGLPDMDGLEFIAHIRETHSTRAIAVTGRVDEESQTACLAAGFNSVLAKPFTIDELEAHISENDSDSPAEAA